MMYEIDLPTERRVQNYLKNKSAEQIREDLYQAQLCIYDAWEAEDEESLAKFTKKALKKSPLCADAYLLYVQSIGIYNAATAGLLQFAVLMAERGLVEPLSHFKGCFWGDIDTRPYMRARAALAECLWKIGDYEDAMEECEALLTLNPNDNQGIRYLLANYYLELERLDKLSALFKQYSDESSTFFAYNKALLAYKKKNKKANELALEAIHKNSYIVRYLLLRMKPFDHHISSYMAGSEQEAIIYVTDNIRSWLRAGNAIDWIAFLAEEAGIDLLNE